MGAMGRCYSVWNSTHGYDAAKEARRGRLGCLNVGLNRSTLVVHGIEGQAQKLRLKFCGAALRSRGSAAIESSDPYIDNVLSARTSLSHSDH